MSFIRRLEPSDNRKNFSCGNDDLDRFFRRFAGQNQFRHHIGTTYIAVEGEEILGFVTVAATQVESSALPEKRKKRFPYPIPALRLARLGVATHVQGRKIGLSLLKTVFRIATQMSNDVGCVGVVVDAKTESVGFYRRYGFVEMDGISGGLGDRPQPVSMFLPLEDIPEEK
ncbi:MAG: GNAT family N-acetyltransferase [Myxococcota bacterium]